MQLKRHYEFLTQTAPGNQVNRSRFWTHYMRGVHGDMDTRYDASAPTGSRRARASSLPPRSRSAGRSGRASSASLRFRPELSNTYGFTPRDWTGDYAPSVEYEPDLKPYRPSADYTPRPSAVDKLKGFDEPDFSVPSRYLRNHPIGLEVDGLLNGVGVPQMPAQEPEGPSAEEAKTALEILRSFLDNRANTTELPLFDALREIDVFVRSSYRHESRYSFQKSIQMTSKRMHKSVQKVITTEG
ncbi:uncharacterized protein LOC136029539 isoform X2 [Artemia franciscana]|uniref:uncharacterized protein LOC136029539 isoform X2 n=1 Tax=Artemia franciscana TaxID=6661 RepID=UPI0032DB77AF